MSIFAKKKLGAVFGLALCASAAGAVECTFTTECIAGEVCTDAEFAATLLRNPENIARVEIETVFGTIPGIYSNTGGEAPESVTSFLPDSGDSYHLTWTADAAWMTLHMPSAEMAITYVGTCEADK